MKRRRLILSLALTFGLLGSIVPAAADALSCATYHVVGPGENLFRIGLHYNLTVDQVAYANGILNPNHIYVGQRLCIPAGYTPAPTYPKPSTCYNYYKVRYGDTLGAIAYKFGTSVYQLKLDNYITNPNLIYVGMALCVPNKVTKPYYPPVHYKPTPTPAPTSTPVPHVSTCWVGWYFANRDLGGQPAFDRIDCSIAFDWDKGSPGPKIPEDLFSVKWVSTQWYEAETYRFYALVDDGIRLYVNDQIVINEWREHNGDTIFYDWTFDEAGSYTVRVEYFEFGHDAQIFVWWEQR